MTQSKKRLGLTVPITMYEKLLEKSQYQGKTINSTCLDIFWDYFESKERPDPTNPVGVGKEE